MCKLRLGDVRSKRGCGDLLWLRRRHVLGQLGGDIVLGLPEWLVRCDDGVVELFQMRFGQVPIGKGGKRMRDVRSGQVRRNDGGDCGMLELSERLICGHIRRQRLCKLPSRDLRSHFRRLRLRFVRARDLLGLGRVIDLLRHVFGRNLRSHCWLTPVLDL